MAYWVKLLDGGYVNTDTLGEVSRLREPLGDSGAGYRQITGVSGDRRGLEGANCAAVTGAIERQIALQEEAVLYGMEMHYDDHPGLPPLDDRLAEERRKRQPTGPLDKDWSAHGTSVPTEEGIVLARPLLPTPEAILSIDAARLIRQGEERALKVVRSYLLATGTDNQGATLLVANVRWTLTGEEPTITLDEVEPDAAAEERPLTIEDFGALNRLDLRQGDDAIMLRYEGIAYCLAIKLRFEGGPDGLPSRYVEVSYHDPRDRLWMTLSRSPAGDIDKSNKAHAARFNWAFAQMLDHKRDHLREG